MGDEARERVRTILRGDLDWSFLTERALQNRVLSFLYRNVSATCPDAVPAPVLEQHRKHFNAVAARNRIRSQELCRVVGVLAGKGLPCIPFKGPTLAITAYRDLALREFSDLDVLVRREDVFEVQEALGLEGYSPQNPVTGATREAYRQSAYYLFIREDGSRRFRVDLQWRLIGESFWIPLDTVCSWDHPAPVLLEGGAVRSLSPEDLLLVLSIHGAKHHWERLSWICDVAEMVRAHGDLNWDQLLERAGRLGMRRVVAVSLALAKELLDAPVPPAVWRQMQSDAQVGPLVAPIRARFQLLESGRASAVARLEFNLDVRERWQDRVRYAVHLARRAEAKERWQLPLAACFSCLYYLLRPVWLVGKSVAHRLGVGQRRKSPV